jgi:glycosyltransferase involved in cell wall biosynthesis
MLYDRKIAVVVPCYNEQTQIGKVLATMPDYVDLVIVVDDLSTDDTCGVVQRFIDAQRAEGRVVLLRRQVNGGVGRSVVDGYLECVRRGIDVAAVMDGDGQMDPRQLRAIVAPVARGKCDYAKANRLYYRRAWRLVPRKRYLGNAFLSMLTKIASGYWKITDSQTGFTAMSLRAMETIDLDDVYSRYGYRNDMLVRLNVYNFRVLDVPLRPVYNVGERSKMRLWKVIPTMSWLLFNRFCWRMWRKYVIHDFHPLVFFYVFGMLLGLIGAGLFARMLYMWAAHGRIPPINALVWVFCTISSIQFCLFAMWFDMEHNRDLSRCLRPMQGGSRGAAREARQPPKGKTRPPPGDVVAPPRAKV